MKRDGVDAHYVFHDGQAYLRQSTKFYEFKVNRRFPFFHEGQRHLWKTPE